MPHQARRPPRTPLARTAAACTPSPSRPPPAAYAAPTRSQPPPAAYAAPTRSRPRRRRTRRRPRPDPAGGVRGADQVDRMDPPPAGEGTTTGADGQPPAREQMRVAQGEWSASAGREDDDALEQAAALGETSDPADRQRRRRLTPPLRTTIFTTQLDAGREDSRARTGVPSSARPSLSVHDDLHDRVRVVVKIVVQAGAGAGAGGCGCGAAAAGWWGGRLHPARAGTQVA